MQSLIYNISKPPPHMFQMKDDPPIGSLQDIACYALDMPGRGEREDAEGYPKLGVLPN